MSLKGFLSPASYHRTMVNIIESGYLLRYTDASRRTPRISFPCFSIHLVLPSRNLYISNSPIPNKQTNPKKSTIMSPAVHILFVIHIS